VHVSTSIGVAFANAHASPDELLRDADLAMYAAKDQGGSRIRLFEPSMNAAIVARMEVEEGLSHAVARGELRVFYQPIVTLDSGRPTGLEALARWQHPQRGLVAPSEFITLAEETGLIVPIGSWILGEACRQVAQWQRERPTADPLTLAVNVSARQFAEAGFVDDVRRALVQSGLQPSLLCLELTETVIMTDPESTTAVMAELRGLGVKVGVDDFGTGYSSLASLKGLPVDMLKIDRAFVRGLDRCEEDRAIVAAIITLAHVLGLDTVAEGIERPAQAAPLRRLGCAFGQGFYWSRPAPACEIRQWLDRQAPDAAGIREPVA
jgi:EAL domain-containing protein (putative c-di-GMP-specific phosphodiesterase class I)